MLQRRLYATRSRVIDKSAPRADKRTSRLRVRVARPVARFNLSENFLRSDGDERNARKMTAIHQRRGNGHNNHPRNPWTRPCFHERSPLGRKLRNVPDCGLVLLLRRDARKMHAFPSRSK